MTNPTLAHALVAKGGTVGRLNLDGEIEEGEVHPEVPFTYDPAAPLVKTHQMLRARYLGPTPRIVGQGESGFGQEEASRGTMVNMARVLREHPGELDINPADAPAIIAELASADNSKVTYYDLNSIVMPGGKLAVAWCDDLYSRLYPPAAPVNDPQSPTAPGGGVAPSTPAKPLEPKLLGGRFHVSGSYISRVRALAGTITFIPIEASVDLADGNGLVIFLGDVQAAVKMKDGSALNGHFWVFISPLTDVGVTVTILDTKTGKSKVYASDDGKILWHYDAHGQQVSVAVVADTEAFPA